MAISITDSKVDRPGSTAAAYTSAEPLTPVTVFSGRRRTLPT
ncbi:hypothetical protein [Nocardia sp. NPDC020380]